MDLVDMQKLSRWNKGHKYLLTVIDVLSKYAWAVPIKTKSSKEMIRGLEGIRRQASTRRPLHVKTDQGKEFCNTGVQAWFKKHGWHHFSTYGDSKASVVARWQEGVCDGSPRSEWVQVGTQSPVHPPLCNL